MTSLRFAEVRDNKAAGLVRSSVLPGSHDYYYKKNILSTGCINVVAEEDELVIGYASLLLNRCNPNGHCVLQSVAPYLGFIGVLPQQQKKGAGTKLLKFIIQEAAHRYPNEPFLFLEHEASNPVKTWYERAGFTTMSKQDVFDLCGLNSKGPLMRYRLALARMNT